MLIRPGAHGSVGGDSLGNNERQLKSKRERALEADRVLAVKPPEQRDADSGDDDNQEGIPIKRVADRYGRRPALSAPRRGVSPAGFGYGQMASLAAGLNHFSAGYRRGFRGFAARPAAAPTSTDPPCQASQ